jgi:hypothetical protein
VALNEDPEQAELLDREVLELAVAEARVLVTLNVKHFEPLLRQWAEVERVHSGCILVAGLAHHDFGGLLRGLDRLFAARPNQADWANLALYLSPSQAGWR